MAGIFKATNVLFLFALVLAVVCIVLLIRYSQTIRDDARAQALKDAGSTKVEMAKVLVTKMDIEPGVMIDESMIDIQDIPKDFVPETALTAPDQMGRRLAAHFIPQGDMLLDAKLKEKSQLAKPSLTVEPGKRLVTVSVNDTKATAYLIRNNDHVDLVGTFALPDSGRTAMNNIIDTSVTFTFLQKVKVYDIIYGSPAPPPSKNNKKAAEVQGRMARGTTVTFEVTPKVAEIILAAETRASSITMLLRRYDDEEITTGLGTNTEDVLDEYLPDEPEPMDVPEIEAPPPPPTRRIQAL